MVFKQFLCSFLFSFGVMLHNVISLEETIPLLHNSHIPLYKKYINAESLCLQSEECRLLSEIGYYESRNQSDEGQLAVMQTVLNRVAHPRWPNTIKDVVYDGCQFSYTCDGSIGRRKANLKEWQRSYKLAYRLLTGNAKADLGVDTKKVTHYHTKQVKPYWSRIFTKVGELDDHVFYKCQKRC